MCQGQLLAGKGKKRIRVSRAGAVEASETQENWFVTLTSLSFRHPTHVCRVEMTLSFNEDVMRVSQIYVPIRVLSLEIREGHYAEVALCL